MSGTIGVSRCGSGSPARIHPEIESSTPDWIGANFFLFCLACVCECEMYEFGCLAALLDGDLVEYSRVIAGNEDVHNFLVSYTAQTNFSDRELRYLEIMIILSYMYKSTINAVLCR